MERSPSLSGGFSMKVDGERRQVECFSSAEPRAPSPLSSISCCTTAEAVAAFTDQAAK